MRPESPTQAARLLRKAVPLMMKLRIAPTPYNYGIWYAYVSQKNQKLNALMDSTIRRLGSLPNFISKELFHEFLLDDDLKFNNNHKDQLDDIVQKIGQNSAHMEKNLTALNDTLQKSQRVLQRSDRSLHLEKVINYLEKGTNKAFKHTQAFQKSLGDIQAEIASLKEEINNAKQNTEVDPLTGLVNQSGLERHIYAWLAGAEDDLSILLIDIDGLKIINEENGRRTGTSIIRYLGQFLKEKQVENSIVARLNGGTFAILINEATLDFSSQLANALRAQIAKQIIRNKNTQQCLSSLTVSIGVATLMGQELGEDFLKRANKNLLNAKKRGRNQVATH